MRAKVCLLLKYLIKLIAAGSLAFIFLTLFCMVYSNSPIHFPNDSGATDYKWTSNAFHSQCTEGISYGRTNNEGFMNNFDYQKGMNINILIMGSSHMEGFNVSQYENTAAMLDSLLEDKIVYNIGTSGHDFLTCCSNFNAAMEYYKPKEYVVIETSRLDFTVDELISVLNGTIPEISDHSTGLIGFLSRNPFLRFTYHQLKGFMNASNAESNDISSNAQFQTVDNSLYLDNVLSYLSDIASKNETKIIIVYHPTTQIYPNGDLKFPDDTIERTKFIDLCNKNEIVFLDMTERFQYEYDTNHILPHGFCNSSVGSGHINKYGHEMIASELYNIIENRR